MPFLGLLLALSGIAGPPDPDALLRQWDQRRAAAFESGDTAALRELYVDRAAAADGDAALLADYRNRGLRIWFGMQVFALEPVAVNPDRVVVRVTDRAVAAVGDGVRCRRLPIGVPTTRVLVMRQVAGHWRMVSVSSDRRAAPQ